MKEDTFLKLFPKLERLTDLAMVVAGASMRAKNSRSPGECPNELAVRVARNFRIDRGGAEVSATDAATEALELLSDQEWTASVGHDCIEATEEAIARFTVARCRSDYRSIYSALGVNVPLLIELLEKLACDTWGPTAAHFMLVALQYDNPVPRAMRRMPKRRTVPSREQGAHSLAEDLRGTGLKRSDILIDEENRTVQIGNRPPCKLNPRPFFLLAALWRACGTMVPNLDLALLTADSYGRRTSPEQLKAHKHRLCQQLKRGGYSDLADCVKAGPESYGLLASR